MENDARALHPSKACGSSPARVVGSVAETNPVAPANAHIQRLDTLSGITTEVMLPHEEKASVSIAPTGQPPKTDGMTTSPSTWAEVMVAMPPERV